uniref:RxLR effector candidate protein n=1 Tax=Hyaloperonospora arabidopsidis (strain Emoy2) TaxID=559515 RepID=M4BX26_HYAAE
MGLLCSLATAVTSLLLLSINAFPSIAVVQTGVDDPYRINLRVVYRAFWSVLHPYHSFIQ